MLLASALLRRCRVAGMHLNCAGLSLLLACASVSAQADDSVRQGDYEVLYSAFNTSFLSPEVAAAVSVVRARDRGLLNISLLKHHADGRTESVAASRISGESFNLLHRRKLEFQEIVEIGARYYLAPFKISNDNELIVFEVQVTPEDGERSIAVKFERRYFHN